jgi:hypothetical protein
MGLVFAFTDFANTARASLEGGSMTDHNKRDKTPDANRDPITKEPGAHPVGTGAGAAGGAAAGAAIGTAVGGPVGTLVGGAAGAIAGGLAGKGAAEAVNPTREDEYWRENYRTRPYVGDNSRYEEYQPAYRVGWETAAENRGRKFDEVEPDIQRRWSSSRGDSRLEWDDARNAARDAWDRVERALPGDADRDGR